MLENVALSRKRAFAKGQKGDKGANGRPGGEMKRPVETVRVEVSNVESNYSRRSISGARWSFLA